MEFFKAFRKLPQQIIWRCEGRLPPVKGTNVHITNWMPQTDLLSHKNMAAFITHGGFNSVLEASYAGVPMVMLPFFADQQGNYLKVKRLGFGVLLEKGNLTAPNIYETIRGVLSDKSYAENAKRLRKMFAKKPVSNREQAVKWIEFLAEFQSLENLQPASKYLYLHQYFLIDVILIIVGVIFVAVYCSCCCCRFCCRRVCGMRASKPKRD